MRKRRPDWLGDREREEARRRWEIKRQERNRLAKIARGGKKKFEAMTPEEREQLRKDIVQANDTISALIAEMQTPEAQAEAARRKAEFVGLCQDLGEAITAAEARLAREFPGITASVPVHDPEEDDESWIYFDGKQIWWTDPPRTNQWRHILRASLRVRTQLPHALEALRAALVARAWMTEPRTCRAELPPLCVCTGLPTRTRPLWELQGRPNPRNKPERGSVRDPEIHE